jgi:hypothetical protein
VAAADPEAFPWPLDRVARYTARRALTPPDLDGRLAAGCWRTAERSPRFVDLVSGGGTAHDTRAAILWDDDHLYVGFRLEAPTISATLTERDSHIWLDDDVELFIAGEGAYYELELNALNTIYEVLFTWNEADVAVAGRPAPFDGVDFRHPRGGRTGYWDFDLDGLRTAVHVGGTGWTVELAIPFASLAVLGLARPRDGHEWRIALARFNTTKATPEDSGGWALSPHGVWDSHIPELFPIVRFAED